MDRIRREMKRNVRSGNLRVLTTLLLFLPLTLFSHVIDQPVCIAQSIHLQAGTIDTSNQNLFSSQKSISQTTPIEYFLIQFRGPIQSSWIKMCEEAGIHVHFYLPDFAYLVSSESYELSKVKSIPFIRWAGPLEPHLKIDPDLKVEMKSERADIPTTILSVDDSPRFYLKDLPAREIRSRKTPMGWYSTRAKLTSLQIEELTQLGGVFHLEPEPQFILHGERGAQTLAGNLLASASGPSGTGYSDWLTQNGLTGGDGMIVQVQDDGLDQGLATNLPGTAHPDILGRIAGILNVTSDLLGDSEDGHGQINAGILIGNAAGGLTDSEGFLLGQGVVPGARVYGTKIFRNGGRFDLGGMSLSDLAIQAQNTGVTFSSNSWGAVVAGKYIEESAEIDYLTRDADPIQPGNQPIAYFFSAGNEGPDLQSIGAPGTAKNAITVGAGENSDADGSDGCGIGPDGADDVRDVIRFSSRGPLSDGRIGPTLYTVGTHVQGPSSTALEYDGSGVCDPFWPDGQTLYSRSSGTSHSTPLACGAGMLVAEFFNRELSILSSGNHAPDPSPAMIKAVLANTATDNSGNNDGRDGSLDFIPNPDQGWGSINLNRFFSMKENLFSTDQEYLLTDSGQTWETPLTVLDPTKPLKVTLAWSDAPGSPNAGKSLVNDLDLSLLGDQGIYYGNSFENGFSVLDGERDRLNNMENVYIENPEETYFLQVKAFNIAGNGVPNNTTALDQDFALFVWNGTDRSRKGNLSFNEERVGCEDVVEVILSDVDLAGTGTVEIPITTSSGEGGVFTLGESFTSGLFIASVTTTLSEEPPGLLMVADGATLTATYEETDDGEGNPRTVTAKTRIDCIPPVLSNLTTMASNSFSALVSFQTNEGADIRIDYGTSCATLDRKTFGGGTTQHAILLEDLFPDTSYGFDVTLTDFAGNINTETCFTFTTGARGNYFTERFFENLFDLQGQTLTLTPQASSDGYTLCVEPESLFKEIPLADRTTATLFDDSFSQVGFSQGQRFPFYGEDQSKVFIGSNGVLSFGAGANDLDETLEEHFGLPQISALYDDLDPSATGTVYYKQYDDRFVVTYDTIPEYRVDSENTFQVELYWDGTIRVHYQTIETPDGIVGLSRGEGLPPDFLPNDLSQAPPCLRQTGYIRFAKEDYECGETALVEMGDLDHAGVEVRSATIVSGLGDAFSINLFETDQGSGLFEGLVPLEDLSDTIIPGDDILQVSVFDQIEVSYFDEEDGMGGAGLRTGTAFVNCRNESNTERFQDLDFDLKFKRITWTPVLGGHLYQTCLSETTSFPVDPNLGVVRTLSDQQFIRVVFADNQEIPFFEGSFSQVFLGSNGYLTFGKGDTDSAESFRNHFDLPRVSFFFRDLDPSQGGKVTTFEDADAFTLTFEEVPEHTFGGSNSIQARLFWDGRIEITYLDLTSRNALVGLSNGMGIPEGFMESDLSRLSCTPTLDARRLLHLIRAIDEGIREETDLLIESLMWMN